jgi:beta-lactamase class A
MRRRDFVFLGAVAAASACSAQPSGKASSVPADAPDGPPSGRPNPSALYNHINANVPASPQIGWAVKSLKDGGVAGQNASRHYLQQSVFKLWVAMVLLDKVDQGEMKLDDPITVTRADLGFPYQPIAEKVGAGGYRTTMLELIRYIVILSDNPSADILLKRAGGPAAVTAWLRSKGISDIRVDRNERGLHAAADEIDSATGARQNALVDAFVGGTLEDTVQDGATPDGCVEALAKLHRGELLSPASTRALLQMMGEVKTGAERISAALEPGWTWAHKTGTGGHANGQTRTLGVNDIGLLTAPDGETFAVAVFVAGASQPVAEQEGWIAHVGRGVIAQWKKRRADMAAAAD